MISKGEAIILVHVDLLDVLVSELQDHLLDLGTSGLDVWSHIMVGPARTQDLLLFIKQRVVEICDVDVVSDLL